MTDTAENYAAFEIVTTSDENGCLVIRDMGVENMSVTNDAEDVVRSLFNVRILKPGQRLLYYDSVGKLDELLVKDGKFAGFAPGPK